MDAAKRTALISALEQSPDQVVDVARFFDGNDDVGSIGCNLSEHPGIATFRDVLTGLSRRADVDGVYARVAEVDPGAGCWPFADTVFVAGTVPEEELRAAVAVLQPDEVAPAEDMGVPPSLEVRHDRMFAVWWD